MRWPFALLAVVSLTAAACASITTDSLQMISLTSDPAEATCTVTGPKGFSTRVTTPNGFTVPKGGGDLSVTCTKNELVGSAVIKEEVAGATFGNILLGGFIGLAVDAGTGKMWKYPPVANVVLYEKDRRPRQPQVIEDTPQAEPGAEKRPSP